MIKRVSEALSKRAAGDKGFTLIELLVVVIIMGILAAVAIPIFLNMRVSAWKSAVESDVTNATLAVEQAATTNNGSLVNVNGITDVAGPSSNDLGDGTDVFATVNVSDGNTLSITIAADQSYEIVATNNNLTSGDTHYTYSSETGAGTWGAAGATTP